MTQQGQGDVVAPAVMDNSCPFCGSDPYHRTDLGEPVAVTCCETACALWDSRDEDTVEIDRADLVAIASRLREARELHEELDRLRTLLSSSRGEQGWRLVPLQPTAEMLYAAQQADGDHSEHDDWLSDNAHGVTKTFEAMLAAAPSAPGSVPTSLAGQGTDPEEYRDTFSGIVQGGCEACGDCDDDENGECACDRIVNELIAAVERINEEAAAPSAPGTIPEQAGKGVPEMGNKFPGSERSVSAPQPTAGGGAPNIAAIEDVQDRPPRH